MNLAAQARGALLAALVAALPAAAQPQEGAPVAPPRVERGRTVRVVGAIRNDVNAIALSGIPVELLGRGQVVYTDVDGRYILELSLNDYQHKTITVGAKRDWTVTVGVSLTMARYAEPMTVNASRSPRKTSSAEAQLIARKQSP